MRKTLTLVTTSAHSHAAGVLCLPTVVATPQYEKLSVRQQHVSEDSLAGCFCGSCVGNATDFKAGVLNWGGTAMVLRVIPENPESCRVMVAVILSVVPKQIAGNRSALQWPVFDCCCF